MILRLKYSAGWSFLKSFCFSRGPLVAGAAAATVVAVVFDQLLKVGACFWGLPLPEGGKTYDIEPGEFVEIVLDNTAVNGACARPHVTLQCVWGSIIV